MSMGLLTSSYSIPSGIRADRYISVELVSTHPISNNGVGDDWSNFLSVGDQIVSEGEKVLFKLHKRAPFILVANAVEFDEDYPDEGSKSMTFTYSDLIAMNQNQIDVNVQVIENGGRNAGNMAEWMFIIVINKERRP